MAKDRWAVVASYEYPDMVPVPDRPGWQRISPDERPVYIVVEAEKWDNEQGRYEDKGEAQAHAERLYDADMEAAVKPAFVGRWRRLRELKALPSGPLRFNTYGCLGPDLPDPSGDIARYAVCISFEDSSDVSDYYLLRDSFEEAEQEYRATAIYDLDSEDAWSVEWLQKAAKNVNPGGL